ELRWMASKHPGPSFSSTPDARGESMIFDLARTPNSRSDVNGIRVAGAFGVREGRHPPPLPPPPRRERATLRRRAKTRFFLSMLRFETAGESHGECLVATLTGLPAGIPISLETINRELWRRQQGYGRG